MAEILVLDNNTIDKIAAGEVVERPMSVVKELVENSIDSGATIVTVEIRGGGIKMIRVTDNGSGIDSSQIRNAFMSHATSKIRTADDLDALSTLGFRGEALSSIAAVSRVEVTSRVGNELTGVHYCIEGGHEIKCEEVGAPTGTTFIIRDLFFNTLPRLKFLKSEMTEGNYIADLMEHLALSMPHISFQFINNGQTKFSTSGRGDLREVIYRIYGREMSENLRSIDVSDDNLSMHISGYLGLPRINRSNRACEIFFINHRYVKSPLISRAVEEGYAEYLMQHKFPFCILNMEFAPDKVDVNVHPTKQEVRISGEKDVYNALVRMIGNRLSEREMIDAVRLNQPEREISDRDSNLKSEIETSSNITSSDRSAKEKIRVPELFETERILSAAKKQGATIVIAKTQMSSDENPKEEKSDNSTEEVFFVDETEKENNLEKENVIEIDNEVHVGDTEESIVDEAAVVSGEETASIEDTVYTSVTPEAASYEIQEQYKEFKQLDFLDNERLLSAEARRQYKIIGQVFKTYWLIEYNGSLMIMDQHAAHEKVRYERLMAYLKERKDIPSQNIIPPVVVTLANREKQLLFENIDRFSEIGFSIEDFGEHEAIIRAIPLDLYGCEPRELVMEVIKDLADMHKSQTPESIRMRIATMACKSAVKGNNLISVQEVEALLDEMLTLDNPYNCPHGRPTMISMTKQELEKKFHRIV